jgi:hypothetical protein
MLLGSEHRKKASLRGIPFARLRGFSVLLLKVLGRVFLCVFFGTFATFKIITSGPLDERGLVLPYFPSSQIQFCLQFGLMLPAMDRPKDVRIGVLWKAVGVPTISRLRGSRIPPSLPHLRMYVVNRVAGPQAILLFLESAPKYGVAPQDGFLRACRE